MASCDDKGPSFEESLAELEGIVTAIEQGKVGLQDAITQYETGVKLIQRCREMLADAEAKVNQLQIMDDNRLVRTPMEPPKPQ